LGDGAPPGSIIAFSPTGWITSAHFTQWFAHFIHTVHPTAEDPVLLIFDGHFTHTRNIELINMARANHVTLVCLPPHTSNKTQPLDVSFMKPFKSYYSSAIETWMDSHEGRVVTHFQVADLFCQAYERAATMAVARHGFAATGIMPFNRDIFPDHLFITQKDVTAVSSTPGPSDADQSSPPVTPEDADTSSPLAVPLLLMIPPGQSAETPTQSHHISPTDIRPLPCLPDAPPSTRRGEAKVISASPHKNALLESLKAKEAKELKKVERAKKQAAGKPTSSTTEPKKRGRPRKNPPKDDVNTEPKKRGRPKTTVDQNGEKKEQPKKKPVTKAKTVTKAPVTKANRKKIGTRRKLKMDVRSLSSSSSEDDSEISYASSTDTFVSYTDEDDFECQ
jgi:hypothetical protein